MKNLMKVNNAGGISIEQYDYQDNIISVLSGMEFAQKTGRELLNDLITYGIDWDFDTAGGNTNGYHINGNINGYAKMVQNDDGTISYNGELTASDVIDDHESTKTIAVWDGETLEIDKSGFIYFDIDQD